MVRMVETGYCVKSVSSFSETIDIEKRELLKFIKTIDKLKIKYNIDIIKLYNDYIENRKSINHN